MLLLLCELHKQFNYSSWNQTLPMGQQKMRKINKTGSREKQKKKKKKS